MIRNNKNIHSKGTKISKSNRYRMLEHSSNLNVTISKLRNRKRIENFKKYFRDIKDNVNFRFNDNVFRGLICFLFLGIILGSFVGVTYDKELVDEIGELYVNQISSKFYNDDMWLFKVMFENVKPVIVITIITLFIKMSFIYFLNLFYKGFTYGFCITVLVKILEGKSISMFFLIYLPFTILYFIIYIFASHCSIRFLKKNNTTEGKGKKYRIFIYFFKIILFILIILMLSIFEANSLKQIYIFLKF